MRKFYIVILLFAFISGCEKNFDEIVDIAASNYQVTGTNSYPLNTFRYIPGDSSITIYLNFSSSDGIALVYCDIYASDETKLNANPFSLLDNGNSVNGDERAGDNRFTNKFPLSQRNPIGTYKINYYVTDKVNVTKLVAEQQFIYDNGQTNVAPVISNAFVNPDTLVVTDTTFILTTVQVADDNGLSDIESVYFIVYKPNGSTNNSPVFMFDDGNFDEYGDEIAGDGIFSRIIKINQSNDKGTYRFEFIAKDRGRLFSNTINYFVRIQ